MAPAPMTVLAAPDFWLRLLSITLLNLLLSGDNALVIALAVRHLPRRERVLGQVWGAVGAVLLRLVGIAVVGLLLRLPFLQLGGGLLLVWIAVRLVNTTVETAGEARHGASLKEAVWIIIIADVTMSLDNVLAIAAAAHGQFALVVLGIALSLPIVIFGAELLARVMNRHAWVVWLGGGFLGYIAVEMALDDGTIREAFGMVGVVLRWTLPLLTGIVLALFGWRSSWVRRRNDPATS